MSKCQNCGATMSCGCQRRILANGKAGCTKCATTSTVNDIPAPIVNHAVIKNSDVKTQS